MSKNQLLNIQSFWLFLLLLTGTAQNNFAQTFTANGQGAYESGDHDGYFYSFWSEGGGQVSMTLGPDGNYSTTWSNIQNFTGGKGWRVGSRDKVICFEGSYDGGSNGFLAVYGWTTDDLIEYYVVEDHGQWRPPGNTSDIETFGTVESDGGVYDIYRSRRVDKPSIIGNATFYQFWSVRRTKRSSGTVTFANHVDAWEATGLQLGSTWDYMIMESEGYGSSGSSNITVWECVTCETPAPTTSTALYEYEIGDVATQLSASGNNLTWYEGTNQLNGAPTPNTSKIGTTVYSVTATENGCEGPKTEITVKVSQTYDILKVSSPIVLDGAADDAWLNPEVLSMKAENILVGDGFTNADLSGEAKLLWDNDYLYLLALVKDDTKVNDSENTYEDDNVEFYFDVNNDKADEYGANDVQYSFAWDDGTTVGTLPDGRSIVDIEYELSETTDGYLVEARIPWTTLQASPSADQMIGIDFMINDDDNGAGRDGKLSWNASTDDAWQNPSIFGVAVLSAENIVTSTGGAQSDAISVFPNPTSSSVKFNKNHSWKLYNAYGVLLESGSGDGIDLKEYATGIYSVVIDTQVVQLIKE